MKQIKLTKGYTALVSDEDFQKLNAHKWHASEEGRNGAKTYAVRRAKKDEYINGRRYKIRMHREVMGLIPWLFDNGLPVVDHIDGDGLNNTRENLRTLTQEENMGNSQFGYRCKEEPCL